MATYTLTVRGYHIKFPESGIWDVIGQPSTDISELFEIMEYLLQTGQIEGGEICSDTTGLVLGYIKNGEIVVAE